MSCANISNFRNRRSRIVSPQKNRYREFEKNAATRPGKSAETINKRVAIVFERYLLRQIGLGDVKKNRRSFNRYNPCRQNGFERFWTHLVRSFAANEKESDGSKWSCGMRGRRHSGAEYLQIAQDVQGEVTARVFVNPPGMNQVSPHPFTVFVATKMLRFAPIALCAENLAAARQRTLNVFRLFARRITGDLLRIDRDAFRNFRRHLRDGTLFVDRRNHAFP